MDDRADRSALAHVQVHAASRPWHVDVQQPIRIEHEEPQQPLGRAIPRTAQMSVDDPVARGSGDVAQEHVLVRIVEVEVLGADFVAKGAHDAEVQVPDSRDKEVPGKGSVHVPGVDVLELTGVSPDLARVRRIGLHGSAIDIGVVGVDEKIEVQGIGDDAPGPATLDLGGGKQVGVRVVALDLARPAHSALVAVAASQGQAGCIRDLEEQLRADAPVVGVGSVLAGGARVGEVVLVAVALVEEKSGPRGNSVFDNRDVHHAPAEPLLVRTPEQVAEDFEFVDRGPGRNIDGAGGGVPAPERALGAAQDLHLGNVIEGERARGGLVVLVDAVDMKCRGGICGALVADAPDRDAGHAESLAVLEIRDLGGQGFDVIDSPVEELRAAQRGDRGGGFLEFRRTLLGGDQDLLDAPVFGLRGCFARCLGFYQIGIHDRGRRRLELLGGSFEGSRLALGLGVDGDQEQGQEESCRGARGLLRERGLAPDSLLETILAHGGLLPVSP